jgi:hypothetical protein
MADERGLIPKATERANQCLETQDKGTPNTKNWTVYLRCN